MAAHRAACAAAAPARQSGVHCVLPSRASMAPVECRSAVEPLLAACCRAAVAVCSCCRAVQLLPRSCCCAAAAVQLLPCSSCRAAPAVQLLPCSSCRAAPAVQLLLPCSSCRAAPAAVQLLPCSSCRAAPAVQLLPCSIRRLSFHGATKVESSRAVGARAPRSRARRQKPSSPGRSARALRCRQNPAQHTLLRRVAPNGCSVRCRRNIGKKSICAAPAASPESWGCPVRACAILCSGDEGVKSSDVHAVKPPPFTGNVGVCRLSLRTV